MRCSFGYPHGRPQGREQVERADDLAAEGQQAGVVARRRDELLVVRVEAPQLLGRSQNQVRVAEGARRHDGEREDQRLVLVGRRIVIEADGVGTITESLSRRCRRGPSRRSRRCRRRRRENYFRGSGGKDRVRVGGPERHLLSSSLLLSTVLLGSLCPDDDDVALPVKDGADEEPGGAPRRGKAELICLLLLILPLPPLLHLRSGDHTFREKGGHGDEQEPAARRKGGGGGGGRVSATDFHVFHSEL